uniref:Transmembrane protein 88B n=1 Tax=Nothobranchius furzeri TaxID=105023 RepID=A0A1A8VD49_NOTFU
MCGVDVDLDDGPADEEKEEDEFWTGDAVKMLPPPMAHIGALLLLVVFCVVLLPSGLLLYAGFLCHSRVLDSSSTICRYLDDNSCSALIILGFVMMSPLVVVAAAIFCGLLRRFRLLLFIQPIGRARYRGRLQDWVGSFHAWV